MKVINRVNKNLKTDDPSVGGSPLKSGNKSIISSSNQSPIARNNTSPVRTYKMRYSSPYKIAQNGSRKIASKANGRKEEMNLMAEPAAA